VPDAALPGIDLTYFWVPDVIQGALFVFICVCQSSTVMCANPAPSCVLMQHYYVWGSGTVDF